MLFNRKAQSTAEYAIIIGVVVGAIMAVGVFLRGGIEAKVRDMTNRYLESGGSGVPSKFSTAVMHSNYETQSKSQIDVRQQKDLGTGSEIKVGGNDVVAAETLGKTERKGKTVYFEK